MATNRNVVITSILHIVFRYTTYFHSQFNTANDRQQIFASIKTTKSTKRGRKMNSVPNVHV